MAEGFLVLVQDLGGQSEGVEDSHFHLTDLGFGISAVCNVHEIADFGGVHFLVLGCDEHGCHTDQFELLAFNLASVDLKNQKNSFKKIFKANPD